MNVSERRTALVTAHLMGDEMAMATALSGATEDDLVPLCGALVATTGNMVKVIAEMWGCSPSEAWEAIQNAARTIGAR